MDHKFTVDVGFVSVKVALLMDTIKNNPALHT